MAGRNRAARRRRSTTLSPKDTAWELCRELRSILRQRKELYAPIERFEPVDNHRSGERRFYAMFDLGRRRRVQGLQWGGVRTLGLPDEPIWDRTFEFAKSVWHLKDYLIRYVQSVGVTVDIEGHARKSKELMICADLANMKKHGENRNRSGLRPTLGEILFDTSRSGKVELFWDGGSNDKELIVQNPVPIHYKVPVRHNGDKNSVIGDAREILNNGFEHWVPLIEPLNVVPSDDQFLQSLLFDRVVPN